MERTLGDAIDDVAKQAESLGPPPDPEQQEKMHELLRGSEKDRALRNDPLAVESFRYIGNAQNWLSQHPEEVPENTPLGDALAVVRWYQHFIHVKFCRALSWFPEYDLDLEEDESWREETDEIPSDSDGSAKIAIIGIERSISAWSALRELLADQRDPIIQMMAQLVRIRALADRTFPNARQFHRPGFDDEPPEDGAP
jgi:hypothetical protein